MIRFVDLHCPAFSCQVLEAPTAASDLMQAAQLSEAVCDQADRVKFAMSVCNEKANRN